MSETAATLLKEINKIYSSDNGGMFLIGLGR